MGHGRQFTYSAKALAEGIVFQHALLNQAGDGRVYGEDPALVQVSHLVRIQVVRVFLDWSTRLTQSPPDQFS